MPDNLERESSSALRSAMDPFPDRGTAVFIAKLAVESERYEYAVDMMKRVALTNKELTTEERNLIAAAYKNVIALRRASWRILVTIECRENMKGNRSNAGKTKEYAEKVEAEINGVCSEITSILTHHVLPSCTSPEHQVFYYKMIGDCFRYRAELRYDDQREELAQEALTAYDKGTKIAEKNLHVANPIRLGLALNYSVFYYDICNSVEIAHNMAQRAFNEAKPELGTLNGQARIDSEQIVKILEVNLTRWATAHAVKVATLEGT